MENEIKQILNFSIFFIILNSLLVIFNKKIAYLLNIYDKPDNKRKLHKGKPSLIGGVYLFVNLVLFFFIINFSYFSNIRLSIFNEMSFFISITIIFLIGIFDDKYDLSANSKLALLCLAVLVSIISNSFFLVEKINLLSFQRDLHLHSLSYFFTLLCILLFMNSFNMMDGTKHIIISEVDWYVSRKNKKW